MTAPVRLTIDELVLEGFGPLSHRSIARSAERHLATLIGRGGLGPHLKRSSTTPTISAGPVRLRAGATAPEVGRAIAAAVYEGVCP